MTVEKIQSSTSTNPPPAASNPAPKKSPAADLAEAILTDLITKATSTTLKGSTTKIDQKKKNDKPDSTAKKPVKPDDANKTANSTQSKSQSVSKSIAKVTEVADDDDDFKTYDHKELLEFLSGTRANVFGVTLTKMQGLSFDLKESKHDYIQWMWPTKTPTSFKDTKGPAIDDEFAKKMSECPQAVENAKKSFEVMLDFYGLEYKNGKVVKSDTFKDRCDNWMPGVKNPEKIYDHNHSRLSRIIESLQLFGLKDEAMAFFDCLKQLWAENINRFEPESVEIWCKKAGKPWDKIKAEHKELREVEEIEKKLDNLIAAKKDTHWIAADLSVEESSWFGRIMWAVCKHFQALRNLFYGVNLKQSYTNWIVLTKRVSTEPRLRKLKDKWREAAQSFNTIVSEKSQLKVTRTFKNIKVTIKPGDITKEPVDVIVNAANEKIKGGSGVDGAIHEEGGEDILKECIEIRKTRKAAGRNRDSAPGEAVTTTAGKLPAKHVVHTVGPRWEKGKKNEEATLYKAYVNSLDQANLKKAASVNFPSLSTGIFGFPLEKAAPKMVQAIKDYAGKTSTIRKVGLIVFWPKDFIEYGRELIKASKV